MFNQKTIEMNYTEAKKYLARAEKNGYVAYYSGIVSEEVKSRWGGNTTGYTYGINIDGDGHDGRYFGCPRIIWDVETAEEMFPTRKYSRKVITEENFNVFFERYPKNTYPKIMWVQNTDGEEPVQRVVFAEKCGKYLAWWFAETFEQAEKETRTLTWEFASDTDPRVEESKPDKNMIHAEIMNEQIKRLNALIESGQIYPEDFYSIRIAPDNTRLQGDLTKKSMKKYSAKLDEESMYFYNEETEGVVIILTP